MSLIAAASIQAAEPMVPGSMSTDRGGEKSAIDAYSDGGGVYMYDNKGRAAYDNSPMNNLVFKYGSGAKDSGASLRDQVKTLSQSTADEKLLADKIPASSASINPPSDGTTCNDFDPKTINDVFTAGACIGTNIEGQVCDDNILYTYNDRYINGVCVGSQATSCKDVKTIANTTTSGVYRIKSPTGGELDMYCDMVTDGGGWTDVYKTFKYISNSQSYRDKFFLATNLTSNPVSNENGFYITYKWNEGVDAHSVGIYLDHTILGFKEVKLSYILQGGQSAVDDRCASANWIPLNGPNWDGGYTVKYLASCPAGRSCIQGSSTVYRDAAISATYENSNLTTTDMLTWSGSALTTTTAPCSQSPEIPTTTTAIWFSKLLLR